MARIANEKGQAPDRPALRIAGNRDKPFHDHRQACRALLNSDADLTWRAGQFVGGMLYQDRALSEKQLAWLLKLLSKAGLPPFCGEA